MALIKRFVILVFLLISSNGYSDPNFRVIFPDQMIDDLKWTAEEKRQDISIRHLHRSKTASTHIIRLKGQEFPHYHDYHDLQVSVLSGQSTIHFKQHHVKLNPGDVIFIPKGVYHWAENTGDDASIVFATFSPGFDGKDRRKAE